MPTALELMTQGVLYRSSGSPASALGMIVADTTTGFLGSLGLGNLYSRYAELPGWKGKLAKNSPEILGGLGKAIEVALTIFFGPGWGSGLAGSLGQVGVNAIGLEMGLDMGRKATGVALVKVPSGVAVKSGALVDPKGTYLGALPPAEAGHGVAWDHIREMAQMH